MAALQERNPNTVVRDDRMQERPSADSHEGVKSPPSLSGDNQRLATSSEDVTYITAAPRKLPKKAKILDDDEPLIDTTAPLPKKSKKTERAQRRLAQKQQKTADLPKATTLLDLPAELLGSVFAHLRPSDIFRLLSVNRIFRASIQANANAIARDIIRHRYWVLSRCFPLPVAFDKVDGAAHAALLSEKRQGMLEIHRKPYQHIKGIDPVKVCTCLSCVMAWNHLCLVLDLAHWQPALDKREPLPMIPRGSTPEWNRKLLDAHAAVVEKAMNGDLLSYSVILEKHLHTTVRTLLRTYRGKKTVHPKRLYHITSADAEKETDEFLQRSGPPSYEVPWHRDNYYGLEAFVPNRKWSKEREQWLYYAHDQHERDLQWVKDRFTPKDVDDRALETFIANFQEQTMGK